MYSKPLFKESRSAEWVMYSSILNCKMIKYDQLMSCGWAL